MAGLARAIAVIAVMTTWSCAGSVSGEPPADLILTGGAIYSLSWPDPDPEGRPHPQAPFDAASGWYPDAEAVAIQDGRIMRVGGAGQVLELLGPDTRLVDLGGAVVLPGLVDSHTHVAEMGAQMGRLDLTGVATEEEAVERAANWAEDVPAGQWILGSGWDEGAWADRYPTLELLSERVPDHPVYLRGLHGFAGWGNRLALERAGITRETPDPPGGRILRDASGRPAGTVLNRAVRLLDEAVPAPTLQDRIDEIDRALEEMARSGYTSVHEAGVDRSTLAALERMEAEGALDLRVYALLSARDEPLMRDWIARGPAVSGSRLTVRAVKAYYDGALGSRGARLLSDYADAPGQRGLSGSGYGFDEQLVEEAIRAGFQVGIHAIGDAGNREVLDFLERVLETDSSLRQRHRVEHAQVLAASDLPRFAELGLIASMEPPHAVEDKGWAEARLGEERILGAYAWRSLRRAGAKLTFNSDLPGSDHDIFYGLHAAITRRDADLHPERGWYPEQALSAEEAVRAYSTWSAYASHAEHERGTIEPGRLADLTVLDVDPFRLGSVDPAGLLDGTVLMTVVGGRIVFEAGGR